MDSIGAAQPETPTAAPAERSFCDYLARQLVAKKGFVDAPEPELASLAPACDRVLRLSDGYAFTVLLLLDRERRPDAVAALSPADVERVGRDCVKYTGRVGYTKIPVVIAVMEVGPAAPDAPTRLGAYKPASMFSRVQPSAWSIDPTTGAVWTNQRGARFGLKRFVEALLRSPREPDDVVVRPDVAPLVTGAPVVTYGLLAILAAFFACEIGLGVEPLSGLLQPGIGTLVAMGGLSRDLVLRAGEWWRLFSAPLLHVDVMHLLFNGFALYLAGSALEVMIGRAWFGAILAVSALAGAVGSLALNASTVLSVGASGAIMGLFAAMLVLSFRFPPGGDRTALRMTAIYTLIPSMLPLSGASGHAVDLGAHFGGAVGGAILGALMVPLWPRSASRPGLRPLAGALAAAGIVVLAYPAWGIAGSYRSGLLRQALIPQRDLPRTDAEVAARGKELAERYPRDPRARLWRGIALYDAGDLAGAEAQFRAGLAERPIWGDLFVADMEERLRIVLAVAIKRDRFDEAKRIAEPACRKISSGALRELLDDNKLCGR